MTNPLPGALRSFAARLRSEAAYPVVLCLVATALGAWQLHLLLDRIIPRLVPLVSEAGVLLPLPVRIAIALFGGSAAWLLIAVPLAVCATLWLGLAWRPNRSLGPNVVLTVCVTGLLLILVTFLSAVSQIADILSRQPG